jgi:hypothetical protein
MVHAVVAMNSVSAEVPFVSLLGDTFEIDPRGFVSMLSDILVDGLVMHPEGSVPPRPVAPDPEALDVEADGRDESTRR